MTLYIPCKLTESLKQVFIFCALAVVTFVTIFTGTSNADLTEITKLISGDGAYSDYFGSSVSISGDYALVGAPGDDEMSRINCGSVYIFKRSASSWIQMGSKLIAQDGAPNDAFGYSVSINGEYAIVGAPFHSHFETYKFYGTAYIFKLTENVWQQVAKLSASDKEANDYFGSSVAISSGFAIVGAPFDDDNGKDSGSAYIFQRSGSTWSQVKKLLPAEVSAGDYFGNSVAINGDDAVVGAPRDDNERGTNAGSIYI